jgi:deoxyribonuclease V
MLACLDADYRDDRARVACVLFETWGDAEPAGKLARELPAAGEYQPGNFYRRELPCLLAILAEVETELAAVIVDGYVWLDGAGERPGLGAHLWETLDRATPVIGVAKNPFAGAAPIDLRRGESARSLHITAAGADPAWAAERIAEMHGDFRIPTLLRRVDQLSREWAP